MAGSQGSVASVQVTVAPNNRISSRLPLSRAPASPEAAAWPGVAPQALLHDRELAVVTAAKMRGTVGCEVRVVHVPTGEVVYRKHGGD